MEESRESGKVKEWRDKGFGFIIREDSSSQTPDRQGLIKGSKVSFVYQEDEKGGKALQVQIEEAAEEDTSPREMGTIKRWNTEKGFGFIGRAEGEEDAFVHRKDCGNKDLAVGQAVSFVFEQGSKGASAKNVKEEEGGEIQTETVEEEEDERELGKVKTYNEEKGFAFIGRCAGGDDLFAHKKEFGSLEPFPGQPVSFVVESTDKGEAAKKVREEESVPELPISDEGREFGTIRDFNQEKGFGFIIRRSGGDQARFFDKALNGMTPTKGLLISFVCEEGEKGPLAKYLREEDPARVARVTTKVHYGRVESYWDPTEAKPTNGYGFIVPFAAPSYGAPKKYYFHMDELEDPDEDGGIEPNTNVSFIVLPAKKGVQAASVKIADPPVEKKDDNKENVPALEKSFADTGFGGDDSGFGNGFGDDDTKAAEEAPTVAPAAAADDAAWDF